MPRRRINGGNGSGSQGTGQTAPASAASKIVRCAIYTRKSTSEGLDKAFNSLDAQREACEAYIASQKAFGWQSLPTRYDDGGFTGGNMERPAVQQLVADIEAGRINCVVVYKVDRLSRSLLDFARIIKLFEDRGVHFVSVTQHFNTADSMGRLTLNILLSFAQFEREIIAERTRDKIAAARRRGQWAGGRPILGYDLVPGQHRLLVNPAEAQQVRAIFGLYLQHESLLTVAQELNTREWTTKRWVASKGAVIGGKPFDRANLHHLLTNVAYIGRVRHRQEDHPGEQEAIVDAATWDRVQALLRRNARTTGSFLRNKHGALLKGLLRCRACDAAMVQMVSRKGPRLHRYYACTKAQKRGYDQCPTGTILAGRLEQEVCAHLRRLAIDVEKTAATAPEEARQFFSAQWESLAPIDQARVIRQIVERVEYDGRTEAVVVTLTPEAAARIAWPASRSDGATNHIEFTVSDLKPRHRRVQRPSRSNASKEVAPIVRTLVLAFQIKQAVQEGRARDDAEVARQLGMTRARISQIMSVLRLSPPVLERLLTADPAELQGLTERRLRPVAAEPDHAKQWARFEALLPIGSP